MAVSADQVVQGATDLGKPEFTRKELAEKLNVKPFELGDGMKAAREAGKIEKAGENDDGKGVFRLAQ
jgi:transcription initiation factor IIE alpha subunit